MWSDLPLKGAISVIPNGIARQRFGDLELGQKPAAREKLGLPDHEIIAVCVGSVTIRKGQLQLARAFAELPARVRDRARILFIGAGEGKHAVELRAAVASMPGAIRDRISIVSTVRDVAPYFAAADLTLLNSRSEAYPRSIMESLLWGVPVLSTPVFGVREQVRPGEDGFLYEQDDMETWSSHFSVLVTDDALRSAMSASARRSFFRLMSYPEMLLAYQTILARLLPQPEEADRKHPERN
jgi:glycosyltransferase involved in cell wall biosynthesis